MRIVNPTFGHAETATTDDTAETIDWQHAPMCMFTNAKPNATELLQNIRGRLSEELDRDDIGFEAKHNSAVAADPALLDWLAQQYRIAVLAVGD